MGRGGVFKEGTVYKYVYLYQPHFHGNKIPRSGDEPQGEQQQGPIATLRQGWT